MGESPILFLKVIPLIVSGLFIIIFEFDFLIMMCRIYRIKQFIPEKQVALKTGMIANREEKSEFEVLNNHIAH